MSYSEEQIILASKKPDALNEDDPPMLRFEEDVFEDRQESLRQGRTIVSPILMVYLRARGDTKTEVGHIVEGWSFEEKIIEKEVQRPVSRWVERNGEHVEEQVMITDIVEESYKFKVQTYPWLETLKYNLHNGYKSQKYYDYCMAAYKRYKDGQADPVEGTPIKGWNQISKALQENAVTVGINTIERAADMSEEAMNAIGMGARDMKRKAVAYLTVTDTDKAASKLSSLETENEILRENQNHLAQKLAELEKMQEKPKRGRPPKIQDEEAA